jgi:hypothetical protein
VTTAEPPNDWLRVVEPRRLAEVDAAIQTLCAVLNEVARDTDETIEVQLTGYVIDRLDGWLRADLEADLTFGALRDINDS